MTGEGYAYLMVLVTLAAGVVVSGLVAQVMARRRGRGSVRWFILGAVLPLWSQGALKLLERRRRRLRESSEIPAGSSSSPW